MVKPIKHYIRSIEKETLKNNFFRKVLFTGKHEQLVVMCLKPKEEIGNEVHPKTDQFFRIEKGEAKFILNNGKDKHVAKEGYAVIVPAGTYHNVSFNFGTLACKKNRFIRKIGGTFKQNHILPES